MTKKVVLVLVLMALLALVTASAVQAGPRGSGLYKVNLVAAYPEGVYLTRGAACSTPCNTHGVGDGYALHVGYGATQYACTGNTTQRDTMTSTSRWEPWDIRDPDGKLLRSPGLAKVTAQGPEVGDVACVFWCCQPIPAMMIFHWEFATVVYGDG